MISFKIPVDMHADYIVDLISAHQDALDELRKLLPEKCGLEGHVWGETKRHTRHQKQTVSDADGSKYEIITGESVVYDRKCKRCGFYEQRGAVVTEQNPFQ